MDARQPAQSSVGSTAAAPSRVIAHRPAATGCGRRMRPVTTATTWLGTDALQHVLWKVVFPALIKPANLQCVGL